MNLYYHVYILSPVLLYFFDVALLSRLYTLTLVILFLLMSLILALFSVLLLLWVRWVWVRVLLLVYQVRLSVVG